LSYVEVKAMSNKEVSRPVRQSVLSGLPKQLSEQLFNGASKIKLAAIGKNDFGEIESMLNPLPCGEIAAGSAPQRGTKRHAVSRASSQLSVIG